jgi:hypothetical protein
MNFLQRLAAAVSSQPDSVSLRGSVERLEQQLATQEHAALEHHRLLQAVIDAAPVAITVLDEMGMIVFATAPRSTTA